ncbi:N-acetyltransferase [Streptomyces scopuliridis]|uniref:N-acetyltransferase n=1 Tax=Streptomyces scopuliridis TaxID=452529 RepID=A0ACD4ZUJ2_9ACTN|nr:GNAT family N-acetyltransferase [Streptomyces scopuliridis]WSB37672.1 N-acetyltransferase [Streptomyces scopuliridis]WSC02126.1 N-acetyltransferase [Streptomyces scopuliridis]WSC04337.1 N-acetyltransferase [Streptomyces scopuliridis]
MADLNIRDNRPQGRFEAYQDGEAVGVIAYFALAATPSALVAVHTVVEEGHEGKGIAGTLVREFYAMAAREGVPVVPLCSYAAGWAQRHPDEAPEAPAETVSAAKEQLKASPRRW